MSNYIFITKVFPIMFLLFFVVVGNSQDTAEGEGEGTGFGFTSAEENHLLESEKKLNQDPVEIDDASIPYEPATVASPVIIKREIVYPNREDGYFNDDEIIIQVKVTCVNKIGLQKLEIWEIPGSELKIINCSFPIVTSSIPKILDYEKSDKSRVREEDLSVSTIVRLLKIRNTSQLKRIFQLLTSEKQKEIDRINISDLDDNRTKYFKDILLIEFNKIIESESTQDLNASFFEQMPGAFYDGLDYWIDDNNPSGFNSYFKLEDYKLIKRRLLERAFLNNSKAGIRILSFNKSHENMQLENINRIVYRVDNLRDRETIIFKYYLKPLATGASELRSIVRSIGYLQEESTPITIIKHKPDFVIEQLFDTKDIIEDYPSTFDYSIEYLGGDLAAGKDFNINITAPVGFEIESGKVLGAKNGTFSGDKKEKYISIGFQKGDIKIIEIKGTYSESRDKISAPKLTIQGDVKEFEPDISVYPWWNRWLKMHAELFTIIILILTLIISNAITIYLRLYDGGQSKKIESKLKKILKLTALNRHQTTAFSRYKKLK